MWNSSRTLNASSARHTISTAVEIAPTSCPRPPSFEPSNLDKQGYSVPSLIRAGHLPLTFFATRTRSGKPYRKHEFNSSRVALNVECLSFGSHLHPQVNAKRLTDLKLLHLAKPGRQAVQYALHVLQYDYCASCFTASWRDGRANAIFLRKIPSNTAFARIKELAGEWEAPYRGKIMKDTFRVVGDVSAVLHRNLVTVIPVAQSHSFILLEIN